MKKLLPLLLLPLFVLPLLLLSCKKDDNATSGPTSAQGRVLDEATGEPVPYADVFLLRKPTGGMWYQQQQHAQAGADGRYELHFDADNAYSYSLTSRQYRYHDSRYLDVEPGRKNNTNVSLTPEGFVRLVFVNKPPLDILDYLNVGSSIGSPMYNVSDTAVFNYKGYGGQQNNITYFIQRSGNYSNFPGTYFCPRHDTATYYIDY